MAGPRREYLPLMSQSLTHVDASDAVRSRCSRPWGMKDRAVTEMSFRRFMFSVLLLDNDRVADDVDIGRLISACAEASVRTTLAYGASEPQAECIDPWLPLHRRSQICTAPSRLEVATILSSPGWKRTCFTDDLCLARTASVCWVRTSTICAVWSPEPAARCKSSEENCTSMMALECAFHDTWGLEKSPSESCRWMNPSSSPMASIELAACGQYYDDVGR
jgi:hypothetical protein